MADIVAATGGQGNPVVNVPDEVKAKFPDIVELIMKSESMNNEERNYWLQVLPVMTEDQVKELRDILETEKKKLAAIDAKYAQPPGEGTVVNIEEVEKKRKEAQDKRKKEEEEHRTQESADAEDLLSKLNEI